MKIIIYNPRMHIIGNGMSIGIPVDFAKTEQIINIIEKSLLKHSIIADKIEIEKKQFKPLDYFKSAEELVEDL